jgi:hypothetical protein
MKLFHGSDQAVARPRLMGQTRGLDFGPGFYTTSNQGQAESFSRSVARRAGRGTPSVAEYEFDQVLAAVLGTLRFRGADDAWLGFVLANRGGAGTVHTHDLIIGPVANDDVFSTLQATRPGSSRGPKPSRRSG